MMRSDVDPLQPLACTLGVAGSKGAAPFLGSLSARLASRLTRWSHLPGVPSLGDQGRETREGRDRDREPLLLQKIAWRINTRHLTPQP